MPTKLNLSGIVGEDFNATQVRDFLSANAAQPVEVHVASPGGSFFAGIEIYNALRGHDGPVTTVNDAIAASAASLIFVAGTTRIMLAGSTIMVHRASGATVGNTADHGRTAEALARFDEQAIAIYSRATGMPAAKLAKLLDNETWFDANAAVAAGFATLASVEAMAAPIASFGHIISNYRQHASDCAR